VLLLFTAELPGSPALLGEGLEKELRTFAQRPEPMTTVRGQGVRELEILAIDLSGASIDHHHRASFPRAEQSAPAISVQDFRFGGERIKILEAELALQIAASDVVFREAISSDGKLALILTDAATGNFTLKISRAQLQVLLASAARKIAQKRGVLIDSIDLQLDQRDPCTVDLRMKGRGRKMIFRAELDLSGRLALDESPAATISNLSCAGEGNISALVCAAVTPYFKKVENKSFPLSLRPLADVPLQSVTLDCAGETILIEAKFGSAKC